MISAVYLRATSILAALTGLLGVAWGVVAHANEVKLTPAQAENLGVRVERLAPVGAQTQLTVPGTVTAPAQQIHVVSVPGGGLVKRLYVAPQQAVSAGDRLALMESPDSLAAQSAFLDALIQYQLALRTKARDEALFREGIIAESRLQAAASAAARHSAEVQQKRKLLQLMGMSTSDIGRLERTRQLAAATEIRSPISGVVLDQLAEPGQRVEPSAPLFRVADLRTLWVELHVPAEASGTLQAGDVVSIPALAAKGSILSVGREVHAASQTVPVRAVIDQGANRLRVGQGVQAEVTRRAGGESMWRVPAASVVHHQGRAYVFLQTPMGFRAVTVSVRGTQGGRVAVEGTLGARPIVAVAGSSALKAAWLGLGGE